MAHIIPTDEIVVIADTASLHIATGQQETGHLEATGCQHELLGPCLRLLAGKSVYRQRFDAAAVGIPDPHYGQEILACIVLREGMACSEDELRAFCIEHLGRYKTPKRLRFVCELPRGPSGKVQRLKLLELPD